MDKTITIRIDADQQQKLGRAAKMLGKSMSELVRDILQEALSERSIGPEPDT